MNSESPDSSKVTLGVLLLGVSLAIAVHGLSVLLADPGIHGYEELYNAAHAWMIKEGGLGLVFPLQYRFFCGGCSVVSLLGAGVFGLLGPSILAWRLVGLSFFLLALGSGVELARRVAGLPAALAVAALFACAPPAYQELAQISHGNHPEGGALLLLQLLLAALALSAQPGWRRELLGFVLALLVGLGLFFVRSLVLGLVPLALVAFTGLRTPRLHPGRMALRIPIMAVGMALGLWPMIPVRQATGSWPLGFMYLPDEWAPSLAWTWNNLQSLFHPAQLKGIWGDVAWSGAAWLGIPAFGAALVLILALVASVVWALRTGRRAPGLRVDTPSLLIAACMLTVLAVYLGIYSVYRLSVSIDLVNSPTPWQVRYLAVVYPLVLVAAGAGFGAGWTRLRAWPARLGLLLVLVQLGLPGAVTRWRVWSDGDVRLPPRRLAPDWCYQPECVQGSVATLRRASLGNPLDQRALAAGLVQANDSIAMAAAGELPGSCAELGLGDAPKLAEAWAWGTSLGAILPARDQAQGGGTFPRFVAELVSGLPEQACSPSEPKLREQLWRAGWCHARPQLQDAGGMDIGAFGVEPGELTDEAQLLERVLLHELGSLGRGVSAARQCLHMASEDGVQGRLTWNTACPAWLPDAQPDALGWGLGVALAESRAGRLEQLEIAVEPSLTTEQLEELQQGFDEGWSWACSQHWLPERLPSLQLRWTRDEG